MPSVNPIPPKTTPAAAPAAAKPAAAPAAAAKPAVVPQKSSPGTPVPGAAATSSEDNFNAEMNAAFHNAGEAAQAAVAANAPASPASPAKSTVPAVPAKPLPHESFLQGLLGGIRQAVHPQYTYNAVTGALEPWHPNAAPDLRSRLGTIMAGALVGMMGGMASAHPRGRDMDGHTGFSNGFATAQAYMLGNQDRAKQAAIAQEQRRQEESNFKNTQQAAADAHKAAVAKNLVASLQAALASFQLSNDLKLAPAELAHLNATTAEVQAQTQAEIQQIDESKAKIQMAYTNTIVALDEAGFQHFEVGGSNTPEAKKAAELAKSGKGVLFTNPNGGATFVYTTSALDAPFTGTIKYHGQELKGLTVRQALSIYSNISKENSEDISLNSSRIRLLNAQQEAALFSSDPSAFFGPKEKSAQGAFNYGIINNGTLPQNAPTGLVTGALTDLSPGGVDYTKSEKSVISAGKNFNSALKRYEKLMNPALNGNTTPTPIQVQQATNNLKQYAISTATALAAEARTQALHHMLAVAAGKETLTQTSTFTNVFAHLFYNADNNTVLGTSRMTKVIGSDGKSHSVNMVDYIAQLLLDSNGAGNVHMY